MLPFICDEADTDLPFANMDYIFIPDIRQAVEKGYDDIRAYVVRRDDMKTASMMMLHLGDLTDEERKIILEGCLINYNRV